MPREGATRAQEGTASRNRCPEDTRRRLEYDGEMAGIRDEGGVGVEMQSGPPSEPRAGVSVTFAKTVVPNALIAVN